MDNPELSSELNSAPGTTPEPPPETPAPAAPEAIAKNKPQTAPNEPQPPTSSQPEAPSDPLLALALAAKVARLAPPDEERATALLKERLAAGRVGIAAAIEPMVAGLPWIVCVNAVSAVWESLSQPMRRLLLSSIAKSEAESARRLHLSLARAVFKIDPAAGLKLAAAAAASLKAPDTGALSSKYRQFFFNVLIGKGKPWLLLLPLNDLKAAEADALVHAAIECFPICPPYSQLSILRWAHEAGRLGKKTAAADLETAAKAVARWNLKFQRQLKTEIADLPPVIAAALKPETSQPEAQPAKPATPTPEPANAPNTLAEPQPAAPGGEEEAKAALSAPETPAAPAPRERSEHRKDGGRQKKQQQQQPRQPEPHPDKDRQKEHHKEQQQQQQQQRGPKGPFDFKEAMRGVESYVTTLRNELEQAKAQLRRKEEKHPRKEPLEQFPPAEIEALTRHNIRLEATIADLHQQLEDLRAHHEAVAESCLLRTEQPLEQGSAEQLRSLLSLQLAEPYETYMAMRQEALDKVFRLDYRDMLGKVFETLMDAGIALPKPARKP